MSTSEGLFLMTITSLSPMLKIDYFSVFRPYSVVKIFFIWIYNRITQKGSGTMDTRFFQHFTDQWSKYFQPGAELPIAYYYTEQPRLEDRRNSQNVDRCLIGNLKRVRQGFPFVYEVHTPGCSGGKRYTGFSNSLRPNFE
jgi:hypothetical protein